VASLVAFEVGERGRSANEGHVHSDDDVADIAAVTGSIENGPLGDGACEAGPRARFVDADSASDLTNRWVRFESLMGVQRHRDSQRRLPVAGDAVKERRSRKA